MMQLDSSMVGSMQPTKQVLFASLVQLSDTELRQQGAKAAIQGTEAVIQSTEAVIQGAKAVMAT
jgi:hypothetical protein